MNLNDEDWKAATLRKTSLAHEEAKLQAALDSAKEEVGTSA